MWEHPKFEGHTFSTATSAEPTPFIWKDELYLLENFPQSMYFPGEPPQYRFHEDGCKIRRMKDDVVLSYPWLNHYFSTINEFNGQLVLIGGDYEWDREWWHIRRMQLSTSDNLLNWSKPITILEAEDGENVFNNCLVFDGERYVLLYETDDARWKPKFTFRFCVSQDLVHWEKLPEEYIYGIGKYVGAPAMYWENGYYYLLYLAETNGTYGLWDTRIARSHDLKTWEDALPGRSFLTPDQEHITDPVNYPGIRETNASDVELIEFDGKVHIWWNGGNQKGVSDLQYAVFNGTRRQLLEAFFKS